MVSQKYVSRPSAVSPVFTLWQRRVRWALSGNDTHTVNDTRKFGSGCHKQDGRASFCWQFMIFRHIFLLNVSFLSPTLVQPLWRLAALKFMGRGTVCCENRTTARTGGMLEPSHQSHIPTRYSLPEEVTIAILLKMRVFWDAGLCQVKSYRCFEGRYCRHLQGQKSKHR
jgi:hypothetical protein